jgi:hypothetical protein
MQEQMTKIIPGGIYKVYSREGIHRITARCMDAYTVLLTKPDGTPASPSSCSVSHLTAVILARRDRIVKVKEEDA